MPIARPRYQAVERYAATALDGDGRLSRKRSGRSDGSDVCHEADADKVD